MLWASRASTAHLATYTHCPYVHQPRGHVKINFLSLFLYATVMLYDGRSSPEISFQGAYPSRSRKPLPTQNPFRRQKKPIPNSALALGAHLVAGRTADSPTRSKMVSRRRKCPTRSVRSLLLIRVRGWFHLDLLRGLLVLVMDGWLGFQILSFFSRHNS